VSLSLPAHLIDTVGSAANSTRDAAGELLHDAVSAVRGRRRRPTVTVPTLAAAFILLAVVVLITLRRPFGATRYGESNMLIKSADGSASNGHASNGHASNGHTVNGHTANGHTTTNERNGSMTKHNDDLKARIKEAAGVLSDNDDLRTEGKRDQQAGQAKQAVDKASDKIKDGVDAVKEKLTKS
jgi:uncharacterized protein YjbJ (UPF0337 family)